MDEGLVLLIVGVVLAASAALALGAVRTGLPVLVAFLGLGMLLGSDGPGGIEFDNATLTREAGTVGLGLILYEGGLQTSWRRLREVVVPAALLSTVGVVVSMCVTGVAAHALFDLTWLEAFLLGAVVASTDAAAVFSTLRFTRIPRRLARTLEAESGGNDPMAIALTLGLIAWIEHPERHGFADLVALVVRQIGIGLVAGVALGAIAMWVFARIPETIGAFVPVVSVAAAAVSFGAADTLGGSGFLAVYLVGLAVGSTPSPYRNQLAAFHEGLAFVAQVGLFVLLGLLVFPHDLPRVALPGIALALALMLVARPAAVWISTAAASYTSRDRLLLGWAGLRGAAPIVVATFVLESQVRHSESIFNIVFFVVVVSALVQGTTLERFARRLALTAAARPPYTPADPGLLSQLDLVEFTVADNHSINGSAVRELGLPRQALVAVITRGGRSIPPRGSSIVRAGDRLVVLAPKTSRAVLDDMLARWRRLI